MSHLAHILDYIHLCLYAAKPTSTTLNPSLPSLMEMSLLTVPSKSFYGPGGVYLILNIFLILSKGNME